MSADLKRAERLQILLDEEELAAVDDFRFRNRMPSRAAALRELMKRGLGAEGFSLAAAGKKSPSFGVLDKKAARTRKGNEERDRGEMRAKNNDKSKR
jgi:hypothetical protein